MPKITFRAEAAKTLLREEARLADTEGVDAEWDRCVEEFSRLCEAGEAKTHIAFLCTAMLAKSLDHRVNLRAIKPDHAASHEVSFSARSLCHGAIVPIAAELGIHLGVTGREPLNNLTYLRMKRLDEETPMRGAARVAFGYMLGLVDKLDGYQTEAPARQALRALIAVRRRYQPRYVAGGAVAVKPELLGALVAGFVRADSENGKRAQAAVAGLMDVYAGGRVEAGRINDPSRDHPGDVCVRSTVSSETWEKAIEVRDKPVTEEDVRIFAKRCVDMGVREVAVVMVAESQPEIDAGALYDWAASFGIGLTLFFNWQELADQVLFWSTAPKPEAAAEAAQRIDQRLISIEASPETVALWRDLCAAHSLRSASSACV